jgi:hypothetical protein
VFRHHLSGRVSGVFGISVPPFTVPLKLVLLYHSLIGDLSPLTELHGTRLYHTPLDAVLQVTG